MACHHPIPAWRSSSGEVVMNREPPGATAQLEVPCGGCLGCRTSRARHWAIRCTLELQDHEQAVWSTLTYDDEHKPPTLRKDHLSGWVKRLRARLPEQRVRFFGAGEYGEKTERPHYHAIVYGTADERAIRESWPYGFSRVDPISPAAINYVAGYCAKKVGWRTQLGEQVDPETGEVYEWQPPFVQMSRRPGIGANARRHWQSWRRTAIHNGQEVSVPRYLHEAWKAMASDAMKEALEQERYNESLRRDNTKERREAQELLAQAQHNLKARRRLGQ